MFYDIIYTKLYLVIGHLESQFHLSIKEVFFQIMRTQFRKPDDNFYIVSSTHLTMIKRNKNRSICIITKSSKYICVVALQL